MLDSGAITQQEFEMLKGESARVGHGTIGLAAAIRLPASREPNRAAGELATTPAPGTATERG